MNNDLLIQVMAAFVIVSAVALIAQAFFVFSILRTMKKVKEQVDGFLPKAETFLASSEKTLAESRQQIAAVTQKANTILDLTEQQMLKFDEVFTDAANRAKVQMERVELVLDDTMSRVHKTAVGLNNAILKPIKEITGVAAGLRAAFQLLLRGGRPTVAQVTADEEMFI
jgi:F0F1-type ATP synthase membrane subunit b/b'